MFWKKRTIPAAQVAKDYARGVSLLEDFLQRHIADLSSEEAASTIRHRRREVCVTAWAAAVAAFESSSLEQQDKDKIVPLVLQYVLPKWQEYFNSPSEMTTFLSTRTADYLRERDPINHLDTARGLVHELLTSIGAADDAFIGLGPILTPFIAKNIIDDIKLFNNLKFEFGIS